MPDAVLSQDTSATFRASESWREGRRTLPVCGPLRLAPGEQQSLPFALTLPWEIPITHEFERHASWHAPDHNSYRRHTVEYARVDDVDWEAQVDQWVREAADRYRSLHGQPAAPPPPHHGFHHPGYAPPGYGHPGYAHSGGAGGAFAAAAVGAAGGAVAGWAAEEVLGEVFALDDVGGFDGEG